jgi:hypothetical protein
VNSNVLFPFFLNIEFVTNVQENSTLRLLVSAIWLYVDYQSNKLHASEMAKLASFSYDKMAIITIKLELSFGPGTWLLAWVFMLVPQLLVYGEKR